MSSLDSRQRLFWAFSACLAIVLPTLIAFNVAPSATFLNQDAAFVGWGGFLLVLSMVAPRSFWPESRGTQALAASLLLLILLGLVASLWRGAPWSLTLSSVLTIASALLTVLVAAAMARAGHAEQVFRAFCVALVVAGVLSSVIGLVQVFAPNLPDGDWVAVSAIAGRATGNLRQPNHLSSLLLWSVVAAVWLGEARSLNRWVAWVLALVFIEVIVLSASRTGLLGMFVLTAWGALDRRLAKPTRIALLAAPVAYLALWGITGAWAHAMHMAFGGGERLSGSGLYVSYSRYKIWWNSLALIAAHPLLGVGFGEFNFAWTLTPFPERPVAFFDHAHNIVLQFAVELGLPMATLVLALMVYALYRATANAVAEGRLPGSRGGAQRAALVMVLMAGVHSLLEYPLWYAYFLLPAAFAFGLCLERPRAAVAGKPPSAPDVSRPYVLASMAMILLGFLALYDYGRVTVIFSPPSEAAPLEQRIADGRRSLLFAHHADYAAGTIDDHPGKVMSAFDRAPHYLLDTRLMLAWAKALEETGQDDQARYVAARLKEFHNTDSDEFFAACSPEAVASAPEGKPPFQCLAPRRAWSYEDFR